MDAKPQHYKLQYLPLFWDDFNSAVSYIADVLRAPETAERLLDQVEESVLRRADSPTVATIYKSSKSRSHPYYWYSVGNYMVFYVVIGDVIEFRRFLYGARDLTKMIP